MLAAHLSPDPQSRRQAVEAFLAACGAKQIVYVCPEAYLWRAEWIKGRAYVVAFERLEDRDTWITLNALAGPETALVMECVTRYPKITSNKFMNLQRLSVLVGPRLLVDVVPFTLGVEYVYTPYSYLDRSILGYAHWYAFRENNVEMTEDGRVVASQDPKVLARKLASVTTCDGPTLLANRMDQFAASTEDERASYAAKKADLFARYTNPVKIVTGLADHAHAARLRRETVVEAVVELEGSALVITNLATYATRLARMFASADRTGVVVTSYALAVQRRDLETFDHLVYAEAPIARTYLALDIEAAFRRDASVLCIRGDSKVEAFLYARWRKETADIDALTTAIIEDIANGP